MEPGARGVAPPKSHTRKVAATIFIGIAYTYSSYY